MTCPDNAAQSSCAPGDSMSSLYFQMKDLGNKMGEELINIESLNSVAWRLEETDTDRPMSEVSHGWFNFMFSY